MPVKSPWYHLGIDYIGPISPTSDNGNRYILTICDYFTKWVEAVPLPSKHAQVTANALFMVCNVIEFVLSFPTNPSNEILGSHVRGFFPLKVHLTTCLRRSGKPRMHQ